jgi:hypothetical protein
MADFWDKVKTELDKAGKVAQGALDEGKLRIEMFRLRQAADKSAESLGYAVYRAKKEGREPDQESYSSLIASLAEKEAEIARIESELRKIDENGSSASAPPPSSAPPSAEPPSSSA